MRVPHEKGADVGWLYGHAEIIGKGEPDQEGQTYEVRVDPRHKASFTERFSGRIESALVLDLVRGADLVPVAVEPREAGGFAPECRPAGTRPRRSGSAA